MKSAFERNVPVFVPAFSDSEIGLDVALHLGQVGRQDVIVRFTLSDEEKHLPLDELARRHPIPGAK